jgi:hypothetical protein
MQLEREQVSLVAPAPKIKIVIPGDTSKGNSRVSSLSSIFVGAGHTPRLIKRLSYPGILQRATAGHLLLSCIDPSVASNECLPQDDISLREQVSLVAPAPKKMIVMLGDPSKGNSRVSSL